MIRKLKIYLLGFFCVTAETLVVFTTHCCTVPLKKNIYTQLTISF